jgi:hypothetical protein
VVVGDATGDATGRRRRRKPTVVTSFGDAAEWLGQEQDQK